MRIASAHVTSYRSVIDSGSFDIEQDKTILVGINEAGKTALLKAIQSINAPQGTPPIDYLADYPRGNLNDLQRGLVKLEDVKVAEVTFNLDDDDLKLIPPQWNLAARPTLTMHRYLNNVRKYSVSGFPDVPLFGSVRKDLVRLRAHVHSRADSQAALDAIDELAVCSDADSIEGADATKLQEVLAVVLPFVDEDNTTEENRWSRLDAASKISSECTAVVNTLVPKLPLLVYYSTYFTVRPRIDLESLAARQARGDIDEEYDFGNLCLLKLLGFTTAELSELGAGAPTKPVDYVANETSRRNHDEALASHQRKLDDRQYRLNAAGVTLTRDIRRVWGDDTLQLRIIADGQYLKVMVVNDLGVEVELDQRSEGFRWLVSFFVVFRAQAQGDLAGAVLLLDEPGLSLHALKQQEFRKTISLLAEGNQIIYTTHSPFMVGSDELGFVRVVEMISHEQGTRVHTRLQVDDPRSIFPLQAALGYELAQGMFSQKKNLVCEGVTDMFYLTAVNDAAEADGAIAFKGSPAIIPAGTASKVAYFCTIYVSQNLNVVALLDSDNAGNMAASQDSMVALLQKKSILRTGDFIDPLIRGAEIEDLFRTTLAGVAKSLGWDSVATIQSDSGRPVISILQQEHGKAVSKWKLAKAFTSWLRDNGYSSLGNDERTSWEKLAAAINKAF